MLFKVITDTIDAVSTIFSCGRSVATAMFALTMLLFWQPIALTFILVGIVWIAVLMLEYGCRFWCWWKECPYDRHIEIKSNNFSSPFISPLSGKNCADVQGQLCIDNVALNDNLMKQSAARLRITAIVRDGMTPRSSFLGIDLRSSPHSSSTVPFRNLSIINHLQNKKERSGTFHNPSSR
jgi:hypothetical protein